MRKMRIWIVTALAANLLLLPLLLATPHEVQANGIAWPWGDCCQESVEEEEFCCDNCCWLTNDCNSSYWLAAAAPTETRPHARSSSWVTPWFGWTAWQLTEARMS